MISKENIDEIVGFQSNSAWWKEWRLSHDNPLDFLKNLQVESGVGLDNQDSKDLAKRVIRFGRNALEPKQLSLAHLMFQQMEDLCIQILIFSCLIISVIGYFSENKLENFMQALSIFLALLVVIVFGALNNHNIQKQFNEIQKKQQEETWIVLRNKKFQKIVSTEVVVGDIMYINEGDHLKVDCIMIENNQDQPLIVNEYKIKNQMENKGKDKDKDTKQQQMSNISNVNASGISQMHKNIQQKQQREDLKEKEISDDRVLFSGSQIKKGSCLSVVVAVGKNTQLSQGNQSSPSQAQQGNKQVQLTKQELDKLTRLIIQIGLVMASILFTILSYYLNQELVIRNIYLLSEEGLIMFFSIFLEAFLVLVLSVPEGLPLILTLSMSKSSQVLKDNNQMVRQMETCYVLGCVQQLLIERKGGLTEDSLAVEGIWVMPQQIPFSHITNHVQLLDALNYFQLEQSVHTSLSFPSVQDTQNSHLATLLFKETRNREQLAVFNQLYKDQVLSFQSDLKGRLLESTVQGSANESIFTFKVANADSPPTADKDKQALTYLIGPPEGLLNLIKYSLDPQGIQKNMDKSSRQQIISLLEIKYSLSISAKLVCLRNKDKSIVLLGVIFFKDRLKVQSEQVLPLLQNNQLNIILVTDDGPRCAYNQAREAKIVSDSIESLIEKQVMISGENIRQLWESRAQPWKYHYLKTVSIVHSASQTEKILLVCLLQKAQQVVSYIGYENPDVLAMRQADIGIGLHSGSSQTKQESQLVIIDDQLVCLLQTFKWGKNIRENIQRFMFFQLSFFIVSMFLIFFSTVTVGESPLSVVQVIWLSLLHDVISSIALAGDHPSSGVLRRGQYRKGDSQFLTPYIVVMMAVSVTYQIAVLGWLMHTVLIPKDNTSLNAFLHYDPVKSVPSTLVYNTLFFMQTFQLIAARQIHPNQLNPLANIKHNPLFLLSIFLSFLVQLAFIYLGGAFTRCAPLSFLQFLVTQLLGMGNLFAIYLFKYVYDNKYYPVDKENKQGNDDNDQLIEQEQELFTAESDQFSPITYSKLKADEQRRLVNFKSDIQYNSQPLSTLSLSVPEFKI